MSFHRTLRDDLADDRPVQMKVEDQPLSLEDVQLRKLAKVTRRLLLNASRHYEKSQESTLLWPVLAHTTAALFLSSAVWVISQSRSALRIKGN